MLDNENIKNLARRCELTASNYGNYANRLQKRKTIFQAMLPYYSIVGITNGLIPKFFKNISEDKINILGFWGILISITFLVISMQIALANYPERINSATLILNKLKVLLERIESDQKKAKLLEYQNSYYEIINNGYLISKRYFYVTCKDRDKKHKNSKEVKSHFSFLETIYIVITNFLEFLLYTIAFVLPIIVYIIIFLIL